MKMMPEDFKIFFKEKYGNTQLYELKKNLWDRIRIQHDINSISTLQEGVLEKFSEMELYEILNHLIEIENIYIKTETMFNMRYLTK